MKVSKSYSSSIIIQNETKMRKIIFENKLHYLLKSFPSPNNIKTKYILMQIPKHWNGDCGGLANQMWRFAVLYSLAKSIGRFPGISYTNTWTCDKLNSPREIENTFPLYHAIQQYYNVENISDTVYDRTFEDHCCKYYNPIILKKYKERFLIIAPPPQSPKYLDNIKDEIKELFQFSKNIQDNVYKRIDELFRYDNSHKFCVYTRRGDFTKDKWKEFHKASDINFTEKGIKFIIENKVKANKVYIPESMNRGEDMCFAIKICNSFLLTASSSTYGWWIGYLLEQKNTKIYFDADFSHSYNKRDNFPSQWIPLVYNTKLKKIEITEEEHPTKLKKRK
ncbi:hypothetical protein Mgra_00004651 [Meloidogyne graminicola]|uniref:L-Fucosyltransferase n=1 Tax=Meloidogyne graminicola TaxID=189291 RepID=A0A8S9ZR77_9BILA|nr:hypothetical protein Mgra_00004651 [Meloidogyne graminicola]